MGLFDMFKKKATKKNCSHRIKEKNTQTDSTKTKIQPAVNNKPRFLNKRCCAHCGISLDLLEPKNTILNKDDDKEYCDICAEKLNAKEEYAIGVGTTITLESKIICTPSMGGYALNMHKRITVCKNGYSVATITRDAKGDDTYCEKIIEGGFFANSSILEISKRLDLHADDVQNNFRLLKLIEYDKTIYGQSL